MILRDMSTSLYHQQVDQWIINSIGSGSKNFDDLLLSLPGVYPSTVMSSLQRLVQRGAIPKSTLDDALVYVNTRIVNGHSAKALRIQSLLSSRHLPHPLDYDWRFSYTSIIDILEYSRALSRPGDTIALLGTPSLFHFTGGSFHNRKLILIDKNGEEYMSQSAQRSLVYQCNLLKDNPPVLNTDVVIADPPWYLLQMRAFIWAAARIIKMGGHLLLCLPPIGTKAGISDELCNALDWAEELGFQTISIERAVLSYDSPLFERNALRAEGIHTIPDGWRRGDLALLSCRKKMNLSRPVMNDPEEEWSQVVIKEIKIKVRPQIQDCKFYDPSLISIVTSDILPSISKSDPRRKLADVWTQGNRTFACTGRNILIQILNSIAIGESADKGVSKMLERELKPHERKKISSVEHQIFMLIDRERHELLGSKAHDHQ